MMINHDDARVLLSSVADDYYTSILYVGVLITQYQ